MNFFVVGEIVKTQGLRGRLKVSSFLEDNAILDGLNFVYLESKSGQKSFYEVKKLESVGRFLFLEFASVSKVEEAQLLVGCKLLAPRSLLKELPEGEYYWQDIIGLPVFAHDGRYLGRVSAIFQTGSNDVYVCRGEEGETLIPAIADAIERIDIQEQKMILKALKGLLS